MSARSGKDGMPDRAIRQLPDPPVTAWERDVGRRRGARLALQVVIDARTGVAPEKTARRLTAELRQLTRVQVELFEEELARARRKVRPGPEA